MGTPVARDTSVQSPSGENTFEAFVKNAIQKIQREAWGRSAEVVEIRNACQAFLDHLESAEGSAKLGVPFDEQRTRAALEPLKKACSCSTVRVVEPALGCLHKLVAYAWVQGESSETGNMDDGTLVTEIVSMVVKCVHLGNPSIYLAVIRALLTFATADHFVAHGHCLLHMVRTIFNLAVSVEESNLKRTACNALLQMLNTVVKRVVVTQFQLTSHHSRNSMDSIPSTPKHERKDDSMGESATVVEIPSGSTTPTTPATPAVNEGGTWKLADLAEKQDIEALEAAFEDKQRVLEASLSPRIERENSAQPASPVQSSPKESPIRTGSGKLGKRPRGWEQLTLLEKDVLVVLMAFCKLAGVNTNAITSENYVRHGKLLALELLVKVFENPGHRWENVRSIFCEQLRFPLCLVLIRNCNPSETKAFQFAIRLFVSVMMQSQIRLGLKAELGALYPLLLLRPLESTELDPALLTVTLTGIKRISKEPQLQVDLFINYDCNLKAPNLYERTARALSQLAVYGDVHAAPSQSTLLREAASACVMAMLASLDAWAGPVRDAARMGGHSSSDLVSTSTGNGSVISTNTEVRHFGAAKEKKNSFSLGLDLFNKSPAKGIASLVATGVVLNKPDTIASFLRKNREQLDPAMLGEYLGLHDDMPVRVMHAYVDMEQYRGSTIDVAIRKLLSQFRLPGEAQKIDRIMEKFAERYCQDNPGIFYTADDAYVLSFSLIMLNTDQHNPMAEKRLTKQDFVSMNMRPNSEGAYVEVLPVTELESMFDRIAADEIRTVRVKPGLTTQQEEALAQHRNLASAVGLTQLALPFRSGRVWDKVRGAQIEHEHLLALTQKAMRSEVDADRWFSATHTEHSRPMLEVAGPHFQKALTMAVELALDKESAERSVESLAIAVQLSALLGLDHLCQQFVTTLSKAIGVHSREALLRANPARQIAALRAMITVASDDQAGLLGSSWSIILRTISAVEALISDMRRGHRSVHSVFDESMESMKIQMGPEKPDKSTALGRFFTQIGFSKGEGDVYGAVQPGQAIRLWSDGEGITEMDRVFVRSVSLDGEAVVVFCRSLCQVSHEELNPAVPHPVGVSPRVFSLRKLVECAYYNLGRIRLIWGRLWSTISSHLVTASCHSDQTVAMYSVDSLRQLVGKLLSRDELVNFTTQSDTLRPFVVVLKQCANVVVRELAVQCIEQAMNAHSSRLGSGWMVILEFLSVASLDPAPSVTKQCIDTLQSVVETHWRKWGRGRDALADCVKIALRVARNPYNTDCSLRAIRLIHACAKELVTELSDDKYTNARSASVEIIKEDEEETGMQRTSSVPQGTSPVHPKESLHGEIMLSRSHLWTVIFQSLVEIIDRDDRRRCADAAAEVLFALPSSALCTTWDDQTWNVFQSAMHSVFDLNRHGVSTDGDVDRILSYSATFLPTIFSVIVANYEIKGKSLLEHVLEILIGWMTQPRLPMAMSGVYLLQEMLTEIAHCLDQEGWSIVINGLDAAWNLCSCHGPVSEEDDRVPFVSWIEGNAALDVTTMRTRCQIMIALQRTMHEIHRMMRDRVPFSLKSKMIGILLNAAKQTGDANNNPVFLQKMHQYLKEHAAHPSQEATIIAPPGPEPESLVAEPEPESTAAKAEAEVETEEEANDVTSDHESTPSPVELPSPNASDNQTEESTEEKPDGETEQEQVDAVDEGGPSELPALRTEFSQATEIVGHNPQETSHSITGEATFPELSTDIELTASASFVGFLRMHVEGGTMTIDALSKHRQTEDEGLEATDQLLRFCRSLIIRASKETQLLVENAHDEDIEVVRSQWQYAIKASLVAKALSAYTDIEGDVLAMDMKDLMPHLSMLICNPQLSIRQAVSHFMKTKTPTVLDFQSSGSEAAEHE